MAGYLEHKWMTFSVTFYPKDAGISWRHWLLHQWNLERFRWCFRILGTVFLVGEKALGEGRK
jgi:hypothetical protein